MQTGQELRSLLEESGLEPESEPVLQMTRYMDLLRKWNARVNLTASTDWSALAPLFHEAIWASKFYPGEGNSLLDIGSGAGFPAIPIRILLPRIRLELVESRSKKAVFLQTVVSELGLSGTTVHNKRLDDLLRNSRAVWDCISWKGVKLNRVELMLLRQHAHARTQFWMFHGRELAVEEPEQMVRGFQLLRSEQCVGRKNWNLSIYCLKECFT